MGSSLPQGIRAIAGNAEECVICVGILGNLVRNVGAWALGAWGKLWGRGREGGRGIGGEGNACALVVRFWHRKRMHAFAPLPVWSCLHWCRSFEPSLARFRARLGSLWTSWRAQREHSIAGNTFPSAHKPLALPPLCAPCRDIVEAIGGYNYLVVPPLFPANFLCFWTYLENLHQHHTRRPCGGTWDVYCDDAAQRDELIRSHESGAARFWLFPRFLVMSFWKIASRRSCCSLVLSRR